MNYRRKLSTLVASSLLAASTAFGANVLPTVTAFTVAPNAVSPIPVTTFTATDRDGTVVGYLITDSSTKPLTTDPGWAAAPPTSYSTTKTGTLTLYAWAKDNAAGVSAAKTSGTNVIGPHSHAMADVTGLTPALAAKADASALAGYQKRYASFVTVSTAAELRSALAGITDASAANPYLVKLMPGVYDLGTVPLSLKDYVDVEGSGEAVTILSGATGAVSYQETECGLLVAANNSELRRLTVQNTSSQNWVAAIVSNGTSPTIVDVKAIGTSSAGTGCGITAYNSGAVIRNTTARGAGGSQGYGIFGQGWVSAVLSHVTAAGTAPGQAYGVYAVASSPLLSDVTATASGGSYGATGVYLGVNSGGNVALLSNLRVSASSSGLTSGLAIYADEATVVRDADVTALGGSQTMAISFSSMANETLQLTNVTASARNGSYNFGLLMADGGTAEIDRSTLEGSGYSISNGGIAVRVGASKLVGPVGTFGRTCISSYNGNYAPLSATCQ